MREPRPARAAGRRTSPPPDSGIRGGHRSWGPARVRWTWSNPYRLFWTNARAAADAHVLHRARAAPVGRHRHPLRAEAAGERVGRELLDAPARPALHRA